LPPKKSARQAKLSSLAQSDATLIFYESARRLKAFLEDVYSIMGNRQVVIARELTKKFEEFIHESIEDTLHHLEEDQYKGEIVVLLGPSDKTPDENYSTEQLDDLLGHALAELGMSVRDAAAHVAEETGVQKRRLYARALALNHAGRSDVSF
jgi:16S rRNA (cytidine1402-2'-O)-methyltransferase